MNVLKEKVLGTFGDWVIKGRVVDFNTPQTGKVRRAELFLEQYTVPGQVRQNVGWSIKDIENLHRLLVQYLNETNENP